MPRSPGRVASRPLAREKALAEEIDLRTLNMDYRGNVAHN